MARRRNIGDENVQAAIAEALAEMLGDRSDEAAAAVMQRLKPLVGEATVRRRFEGAMAGAYKDGYLDGQKAGRFSAWHGVIWRASKTFRSLRDAERVVAEATHFSQYNY